MNEQRKAEDNMVQNRAKRSIDLGLDRTDPLSVVPNRRRAELKDRLTDFARLRREAEAASGNLQLS